MTPDITPDLSHAGETPAFQTSRRLSRSTCAIGLLIALCLAGMRFALPWYRNHAVQQRVEALGGSVTCRSPRAWLPAIVGERIAGTFCNTIVAVRLDLTQANNADLQMICRLPEIESLNLVTGEISADTVHSLRSLSELRELTLPGTVLTDENILELRHLRKLQILRIDGNTNLSLTGAESLKEHLPSLSIYW